MWKYSILISYVGTSFCGWQKQRRPSPNRAVEERIDSSAIGTEKPSIQATLEQALFRITTETLSVVGSGRTDSGVHAVGQVAHFVLRNKPWDIGILQRGLNSLLPRSIQVLEVQSVAIEFHAQRSALKKQYSYYFQQGPCALPLMAPFSWWIKKNLDLEAMSQALSALVGEHDFKPFQASGAKPGPTVRTVLEADVTRVPLGFPCTMPGTSPGVVPGTLRDSLSWIRVRIVGTGFLKQMVRGVAGTLLQVGEGRRPPSCIQEILQAQDRLRVGPTAPARALWLEQVWY